MGSTINASPPPEAVPAYDDLFREHPVNQQPPSGSSTAYISVPQEEVEQQQRQHGHYGGSSDPEADATSGTPLQTLYDPSKPHSHCEVCDRIQERRDSRNAQRHCCATVAGVFIVAFICLMLLGIVIANSRR